PRERIVTIAARARASADGFRALGGTDPDSAAFRAQVRPRLIRLAADGDLVVPVARTFPFDEAPAALELLRSGHPGGKLALIPCPHHPGYDRAERQHASVPLVASTGRPGYWLELLVALVVIAAAEVKPSEAH